MQILQHQLLSPLTDSDSFYYWKLERDTQSTNRELGKQTGDCADLIVTEGKGLSQPACPREWKKYEEGN
jgi:hypothetical protein